MNAPEELKDASLLAWHMFIEQVENPQESDRAALIVLCLAWAEMHEAQRHIDANGSVIKLPNGYPGPNPYCKTRDKARSTVTSLLKEFGLTPQSRAKTKPKKQTTDEPQDFTF